jgi:hypothetical protein
MSGFMGSLQSHEKMMNKSLEKTFQRACQEKDNISIHRSHKVENFSREEVINTCGIGRGQENRGGRGHIRVFNINNKGIYNDTNDGGKKIGKSYVQCFYCKIFGHYESSCWKKQNHQVIFYEEKGDMGTL